MKSHRHLQPIWPLSKLLNFCFLVSHCNFKKIQMVLEANFFEFEIIDVIFGISVPKDIKMGGLAVASPKKMWSQTGLAHHTITSRTSHTTIDQKYAPRALPLVAFSWNDFTFQSRTWFNHVRSYMVLLCHCIAILAVASLVPSCKIPLLCWLCPCFLSETPLMALSKFFLSPFLKFLHNPTLANVPLYPNGPQ